MFRTLLAGHTNLNGDVVLITRRRALKIGGSVALSLVAESMLAACRPAPGTAGTEKSSAQIGGNVTRPNGSPVGNARVTLFTSDLSIFRETRTDGEGKYEIGDLPDGDFHLGACALGLEYREIDITLAAAPASRDFALAPDVHPGQWTVIGNTEPETFGGTNSGSVLPDGRIFYCHDATHPILFDPRTGQTTPAAPSSSEQGCHMPTHLLDGRLLIIGGGTVDDAGNFSSGERAVKTVKAYDPTTNSWEDWPDLNEPRWYPGLARLADGRILLFGGGQQPHALRTATCEILDPESRTSAMTGTMMKAGGFGPAMLLYNSEVFCTWEPPQIYAVKTGTWRHAAPFIQPNRVTTHDCPMPETSGPGESPPVGDHPDHTAILLEDGRVVCIGIRRSALGSSGSMVEIYDPTTSTWSLGSSPQLRRSMPKVLRLPTGKILVAGGKKEDPHSNVEANAWCQTKQVDLYDAETDSWQGLADMADFREYHAVMLLIPDGRVLVTAGTRQPGLNPPPDSNKNIEAFSPPYLFRGVRPRIDRLSATRLTRGETFTMDVSLTSSVTGVVLMGLNAHSHWMEGGVPRYLRLVFSQDGSVVRATIPEDPMLAMLGFYILLVMVDDIPSEGRVVLLQA